MVGGALLGVALAYTGEVSTIPIVGSSGGVFGIIVAFGVLYAEQVVVLYIFPLKAKYLAMILCGVEFLMVMRPSSGTAHSVHIGGILSALAYLGYYGRLPRLRIVEELRQRYKQWKIERARKKFQVYLRKNRSSDDPFIH